MGPASDDLAALRTHLAGCSGPAFWRSLDEIAQSGEFRAFLKAEFPAAFDLAEGPGRRHFLKLMAASLALGGLAGCGQEDDREKIVPYVHPQPRMEPGAALSYSSATLQDGFANGALVTTRDGRPIKIEGNPEHPWSRGGTDVFMQASVLGLYDPERSQTVRYLARPSSWEAFRAAMTGRFAALRADHGRGLRLLTGQVTSPSLIAQIEGFRRDFPELRWHSHAAVDRTGSWEGARAVFGRRLETRWRFEQAAVVVALDGDFLDGGPQQVGTARAWIDARRAAIARGGLLELHAAASTPSLTSAKADHGLVVGPQALSRLAEALLAEVTGQPVPPAGDDPAARWRTRAAAALRDARGRAIVLAGATQPVAVQALVHRINAALGNVGPTVFYTAPALPETEDLASLVDAMHGGEVTTLVMLDTNPVYTAAADLGFLGALARVPLKIHGGSHADETAAHADWHLPVAHSLEAWGDARAVDGTTSLIQPTIAPLYNGRTVSEIVSLLSETSPRDGLTILRTYWQENQPAQGGQPAPAFEAFWEKALLDGFIAGTALPEEAVAVPATPPAADGPPAAPPAQALSLLFRPDPTVWDGSMGNNGWLQELPKPLFKTVWENVVAVSPRLAEREGLADDDIVRLEVDGRSIEGPARIHPGQADDTVTVQLGYGRRAPGLLSTGLGYDAYGLRQAASPWQLTGLTLKKTGRRATVATTQDHHAMDGHDIVRTQEVGAHPVGSNEAFTQPTLYPPSQGGERAWGMVIDLDSCIGCNACVVACQAENNSPVVGKEQVALGREMHWLRIDRYYSGALDEPATHFMPVPCMHCEQAPCEVGCPVEATLHDDEGLNLMVYNRCIGTRACSSYCPYKVRHFNFLDYTSGAPASVQARRNPEVTVRARGVMEKCTYCVQRIAAARIAADKDNRPIADGEVVTACQGACPTRAIVFGDLADAKSAVTAARKSQRNYALLGELNTRPRTTYLAEMAPAKRREET